ncbi:ribosomal-protein-alanine N-acetyltransferase [Palleronia aestuarii]|uniref:Ribosomal-protein-alanine N-acetyltransferase n=2 Tax=Palleronia aestuarii TaxID=568105 RepID=A0A2W7NDA7_9RHOB|nr:ribosomal-protein-alanine N-acetyltransferase [Palleronia aestuarii]
MAAIHRAALRIPRPWSADEFAAMLDLSGTFVVEVPQGFALGSVVADEAELLTLAIDPAAQRQGKGRDCLSRYHAAARMRGAVTAFLEVAETNVAARALYARAGYARTGLRRGYYADGAQRIDALLLSRALCP